MHFRATSRWDRGCVRLPPRESLSSAKLLVKCTASANRVSGEDGGAAAAAARREAIKQLVFVCRCLRWWIRRRRRWRGGGEQYCSSLRVEQWIWALSPSHSALYRREKNPILTRFAKFGPVPYVFSCYRISLVGGLSPPPPQFFPVGNYGILDIAENGKSYGEP